MSRCQPVKSGASKKPLCDLQRLHSVSLPSVHRLHPVYSVDAWSRPVGRIGGDLMVVWPVDETRLVAVLGDVMGHGTPAAVVASAIRSTLHHLRQAGVSRPGELLGHINHAVVDLFPEYFITACVCLFDAPGTLTCALAGHPPMLVRSAGGEVSTFHYPSLPMGISARAEFPEHAVPFPQGSTALLYSDGVSDALVDGPTLGCQMLAQILRRLRCGSPESVKRSVRRAIRRSDRPREDDCSLLVVSHPAECPSSPA